MMKGELARRPAFFLVFFFVLGIWAVYLVPIPLYFLWGGSAFFLLLSLWQGRKQKFWSSIAGLVLVMAALDYSVWREKNLNHPVKSFFPLESVSVSGTVHEIPKPGNKKFSAYIRQLKIDSLTININRKFIVTPLNPVSGLTPGDDIFLEKITLQNLSPPRNPGQFDSRKFLLKKGIIGEIKAEINSRFAGIPKNGIFHLKRRMYRIGEKFSSNIKSILPEKEANFLIGILLGKKEEINRDIIEDFQNTGLAHVLAISGLHVGYVVLFISIDLIFTTTFSMAKYSCFDFSDVLCIAYRVKTTRCASRFDGKYLSDRKKS
jgi:predicted membrane metal-binding protein